MRNWVFFMLLVCTLRVAHTFKPYCNSSQVKYVGPQLPRLPNAFSVYVEANMVVNSHPLLMRTQELAEYYDQATDKAPFESFGNGIKSRSIYDYTTKEHVFINDTAKECRVEKLEKMRWNIFGFDATHQHIGSVNDLFKFGEKYNETYIGMSFIRGILCHQWRACINSKYASYNQDLYFTVSNWTTARGGPPVPVFATSTGYRNNWDRKKKAFGNSSVKFVSSYNLFYFRPGKPDPKHFQTPAGIFCAGKNSTQKMPNMPSEFEMNVELIDTAGRTVRNWKEFYDLKERFFRFDHVERKTARAEIVIQDFNTGLIYTIDRDSFKCTTNPLNDTYAGTKSDKDHVLRLKTSNELFSMKNNGSSYKYEGYRKVRDIDSDVWIGYKNSSRHGQVKEKLEWYFSKDVWKMQSDLSVGEKHHVPLRLQIYRDGSQRGPSIMNFFNYESSDNTYHMLWPVRSCYWENRHYMYFRLDGGYLSFAHRNEREVISGIRDAVSAAGRISRFRVSSIMIFRSSFNQVIAVRLYVLGVPAVKGAPVLSPKHTVPLPDAVAGIKNAIKSGKLFVQVEVQGKVFSVPAQKDSYYETEEIIKKSMIHEKKTIRGLNTGEVIGIVIGVILIAVLLTLLGIFVLLKRNGVNLFSYMRFK